MGQEEYHWTEHARLLALFPFLTGMAFTPLLAALGYVAVMFLLNQYGDDTESEPTATDE